MALQKSFLTAYIFMGCITRHVRLLLGAKLRDATALYERVLGELSGTPFQSRVWDLSLQLQVRTLKYVPGCHLVIIDTTVMAISLTCNY